VAITMLKRTSTLELAPELGPRRVNVSIPSCSVRVQSTKSVSMRGPVVPFVPRLSQPRELPVPTRNVVLTDSVDFLFSRTVASSR
jgi:hypothetical protein